MSPDPSKPAPVLVSTEGRVATVTLNRPDRGNAWTGRMETLFRDVIARAEADPYVGVIVLTGAGRQFCVGADSRALEMHSEAGEYQSGMSAPPAQPGNPQDPAAQTRFGFLRAVEKPVIAAVNGAAAGIGFVLMCFCDIRFVASGAKLTAAAPRLGLPAECGISWVLPRLIGASRATEILLSSRVILGDEAASIGLAQASVDAPEVLPRATEYARTLVAECAPSSLRETKRQLVLDTERSLLEADVEADRLLRAMVGSEDFREGVRALTERRPPRFGPPAV
jgi:enoyl-CoA hydratase/carnithine racemase